MKKTLIVLILCALVLCFMSCQSQRSTSPKKDETQTSDDIPDWAKRTLSKEQIAAAKIAGVAPAIEVDLGKGEGMKMVFIPPGEFMMGISKAEIAKLNNEHYRRRITPERPQHKVTISQGFYLSATEVTQAQWRAVMGFIHSRGAQTSPVAYTNWRDTKEFLEKLNAKGKGAFRLPSEAEWEYACRAGTNTCYSFGDSDQELYHYAWFKENSDGSLHCVASLKPNAWGLFDMLGNVSEWVEDDWHTNYLGAPTDGKAWVDNPRDYTHIVRGGSIETYSSVSLASFRVDGDKFCGFRCIKAIQEESK